MKADKVFYNGTIYTMAKEGETVEAVAVYDGKIAAAGTNEEIRNMDAKEYIDLEGRPVIPGMADTHMHLYQDCMEQDKVSMAGVYSFAEMIAEAGEGLAGLADGKWLLAENLHMDYLDEGYFPTASVLDQISKEVPICIGSYCHHVHILNSKALEICGIDRNTDDHGKGMIERNKYGNPNGIIRDSAYNEYVESKIPSLAMEESIEKVYEYLKRCSSVGLTQLHAYQEDNLDGIRMYQELRRKKGLKCRIGFHFLLDRPNHRGIVSRFGDDMLKLGAAKYLLDGSVGAASCLMYEPFTDQPDNCGSAAYTQEELNMLVKEAYDAGHEVAVHAIGDKANDMLLTAIENAYDPQIGWDRPFYMIHATIISETFIERAKKLPVILSVQPIFIRPYVSMVRKRIGDERLHRCFAFRSMLDAGLLLAAGSDAPVCETNPFHGIQCAVTRKDLGDNPEIISEEQAVTVYEALCMYTKNAAHYLGEERLKGTIEEGKAADFVVTDKDIFETEPTQIAEIKVLKTILGGETVFEK